jgi:transcriptional regulator GlxA family with amidase domain
MAGIYRTMAILPLDGGSVLPQACRMHIEILLFEGFDELDAFGPWEVLSGVAGASEDVTAALVTLEGVAEVRGSHGAQVRPHGALSERPDLVVVPGGGWMDGNEAGVRAEVERGDIPAALAARHAAGTTVASVCTGAMLVAAAGLLEGRPATTNPGAYDDLRAAGADVREVRVVDDGDVVTAGAPVCGIDLALHLIGREAGPKVQARVARELAYDPPGGVVVTAPAAAS